MTTTIILVLIVLAAAAVSWAVVEHLCRCRIQRVLMEHIDIEEYCKDWGRIENDNDRTTAHISRD